MKNSNLNENAGSLYFFFIFHRCKKPINIKKTHMVIKVHLNTSIFLPQKMHFKIAIIKTFFISASNNTVKR